jgi:hypothetical protein
MIIVCVPVPFCRCEIVYGKNSKRARNKIGSIGIGSGKYAHGLP